MSSKALWSAIVLVSCLVVGLIVLSRPSEQTRIEKKLIRLTELARIGAPEHPFEVVTRSAEIAAFFTETTVVDLQASEFNEIRNVSRREIQEKVAIARKSLKKLEVSADSFDSNVDGSTATIRLRVSALGELAGQNGEFLEIRRFELILDKQNGDWLIGRVVHIANERNVGG